MKLISAMVRPGAVFLTLRLVAPALLFAQGAESAPKDTAAAKIGVARPN